MVEKVIGILRYFHLVGLVEVKENPYIWLDGTRRCSIWRVSVSFCGFLFFFCFFFFPNFENSAKGRYRRYPKTVISVNTFIVGFTVFFRLIVCLFFFRVTPACALTFVVYENVIPFLLKQMTSTRNNAVQQWKTMGKISAGGFITRFYSATVPTDSIYGKKNC